MGVGYKHVANHATTAAVRSSLKVSTHDALLFINNYLDDNQFHNYQLPSNYTAQVKKYLPDFASRPLLHYVAE